MQQYSSVITVIVFTWVLILALRIGIWLNERAPENKYVPVEPTKACPPHSWRWEEQPGMENTNFIRCQRCMRTPGQVSEGP